MNVAGSSKARNANTIIAPPEDDSRGRPVVYELGEQLGEGGFGQAFRATRHVSQRNRYQCCVKFVRPDAIDTWHREAYFGELLRGVPHVIQIMASFVVCNAGAPKHVLVSELAVNGSLSDYLDRVGPLPERQARRQVLGIARASELMHRMHAVHRDVTPNNIFVMADGTLKLADFGIAKHITYGTGLDNDVFNPAFVRTSIAFGSRRRWRPAMDVEQLGQLLAMLISGKPRRHTGREVAKLSCSDHLKVVMLRSIGPASASYPSASDFIEALKTKLQPLKTHKVTSLSGQRVVFTGALPVARPQAIRLAKSAGAIVCPRVNASVDVIVVGTASPDFGAGDRGRKLIEYERQLALGAKIRLLDGTRFMKLAARP